MKAASRHLGIETIPAGIEFIDCYVSTDASELGVVLNRLGFEERNREGRTTLGEIYRDPTFCWYTVGKSKLEIDCSDIPWEEAKRKRQEIEFMAMSKMRIYCKQIPNSGKELTAIAKVLNEWLQHMAFVTSTGVILHQERSRYLS